MNVLLDVAALLVPLACFVIVVRRTRNLECDDPAVLPRGGVVAFGPAVAVLSVVGVVLVPFAMVMLGPVWFALAVGVGLLGLGARMRELSHARVAARGVLVRYLLGLMVVFAMLAFGPSRPRFYGSALLPWLGCVALGLNIWLAPLDVLTKRPWATVRRIVVVAFLLLGIAVAWNRTTYASTDRLRAYAERFDEPLEELTQWQDMGRVAAWLRSQGSEPDLSAPRERLHAALHAGRDVHPSTLKGAIAAELLGPEEYADLVDLQALRTRRKVLDPAGPPYIWTLSRPVELRALIEAGALSEDGHAVIADRLSRSWPAKPGIGHLEDAREICELLVRLGRRDLIDRQGEALRAMLQRSWCDEAPWFATAGGFSPYDAPDEMHWPSAESNLDALDLMQWVGVPTGIDPAQLERQTHGELRPSILLHGFSLSRFDVLDALAFNRVRAEQDTRVLWTARLRGWLPPLLLALPLLYLILLLRRAPDVEVRIREG